MKQHDRAKKREYNRRGKSVKYLRLKGLYDEKFKIAAENYLQKNVTSLKKSDPKKAYSLLKKMEAKPGDCMDDGYFTLKNHEHLSVNLQVEEIATHFSKISQQYPSPLGDRIST